MKILLLIIAASVTCTLAVQLYNGNNHLRAYQARKSYGPYNGNVQTPGMQSLRKKWQGQHQRQSSPNAHSLRRPVYAPNQRNRLGISYNNGKSPLLGPPKSYQARQTPGLYSNKINWNAHNYARNTKEKPFQSSPKINMQEDMHLQTNQIPNHVNLVKQLDEKGPIHTIPAPNLSPADKPHHIDVLVGQQKNNHYQHQQHQHSTMMNVQQNAQYQVSEPPLEIHHQQQQQGYTLLPVNVQEPIPYQVLHQQQQQQPIDNAYEATVLLQPQFIKQSELGFLVPEMHSFNYEETKDGPAQQQYSLYANQQFSQQQQQSHENDANQQSDHDDGDDAASEDGEELITGTFYSSLPSKKAADSLAELHAQGGKKSDNVVSIDQEMRIYVPDDSDEMDKREVYQEYGKDQEEVLSDGFGGRLQPKNY